MPALPATNAAARTLTSAPAPLRIVFFGPPGSGKTHLLRAVASVAGKGAEESPIDLIPADGSAAKAILPLLVVVDLPGAKEDTGEVHLLDCDGRAAAQLLEHTDELARGELQEAIRDADAIVLTVDVQWRDEELRANFRQFQLFLEALEDVRTFDREAGGFPIFLTLTKCDAIYLPSDSRTQWLSRVTQRQTEVLDHFHDLFDGKIVGTVALEFGSIDLEIMATATQMPGGEPFGIERLTAGILEAATIHRDRTQGTSRRLKFTVGGLISLFLAFLATMGLLSIVGPPSALEKLTVEVEAYRSNEGPPAIRFAGVKFGGHQKTLKSFVDSAEYPRLQPELREYLQTREREFERYREYLERFQPPQFSPAEVRTAGEFQKLKTELATNLTPPAEYRNAWSDTEAVMLHAKWQRDLELLLQTEDQLHGWYRELIRRATRLMLVESPNAQWRGITASLFQEAIQLPYPPGEVIPGSLAVEVKRGQPLTYSAAYRYERIESARRDWESAGAKLRDLVDLCEALGMIVVGESRPSAVLVLPAVNGNSSALAAERLELLKRFYPAALNGSANWNAWHFPDPIRQELTRRLRLAAENGIRHAQQLIRKEILEFDSPGDWSEIDANLLNKPEFQAWGTLLQKLQTWADQSQPNPVEELREFLKRERFEWPVEKVELYLPNALREQILAPDASFTITVTPRVGPPRVTLFRDAKASKSDNQGTVWQFTASSKEPITYEFGSAFAAEVMLRSGDSRFVLKWIDGRTNTYRFDRIANEPMIVRDEQPAGLPQRATSVTLTMFPENTAIRVPMLLPALPGVK